MNVIANPFGEAPRIPPFKFGDCADAAFGTVLRARGCNNPAPVLFSFFDFFAEPDPVPGGQSAFGYRDDWVMRRRLAETLDVHILEHRFSDAEVFLSALREKCRLGVMPVVQIDHFSYGPSHLCGIGHLPHKILVTQIFADGRLRCLDPFPAFDAEQVVEVGQLVSWAAPAGLYQQSFVFFEMVSQQDLSFDETGYYLSAASSAVRENLRRQAMANNAFDQIVAELERWLASDGPEQSGVPLLGLYDIGAARTCHADWLSSYAAVQPNAALEVCAGLLRESGRRWNVFNSIRAMHDKLDGANAQSRAFVIQKVASFPQMLRKIAALEMEATQTLQRAMEGENA